MVSPTCRHKRVRPYQGVIYDANISKMSRSSSQHAEPGVYVVCGIRPPGGDQNVIISVLNSYLLALLFLPDITLFPF